MHIHGGREGVDIRFFENVFACLFHIYLLLKYKPKHVSTLQSARVCASTSMACSGFTCFTWLLTEAHEFEDLFVDVTYEEVNRDV